MAEERREEELQESQQTPEQDQADEVEGHALGAEGQSEDEAPEQGDDVEGHRWHNSDANLKRSIAPMKDSLAGLRRIGR